VEIIFWQKLWNHIENEKYLLKINFCFPLLDLYFVSILVRGFVTHRSLLHLP